MYIPPAISILCFCALLLPTAAITRHVPTSRIHAGPQSDFAQYLFAAAKDQNSLKTNNREQSNVTDVAATIPPTIPSNSRLESTSRDRRSQLNSSKRL